MNVQSTGTIAKHVEAVIKRNFENATFIVFQNVAKAGPRISSRAQTGVFLESVFPLILLVMSFPNHDDAIDAASAVPDLIDDLPNAEEDPELEREFQELAAWLFEAYIYRRTHKNEPDGGEIDREQSNTTI